MRERRRGVPLGLAIAMSAGGIVLGFALARLAPRDRPVEQASAPAEARAPDPVAAAGPAAGADPAVADPDSATPPPPPARRASTAAPAKKTAPSQKKRGGARRLETRAYEKGTPGTGTLDVTAPDGAEVWLDGRRVGTGSTRREIPEGNHRIEVRYRGSKVAERFHVAPRETWTYAVTPQSR